MEGFLRQAGQIQDELARLETQHKGLARHPGKPFDWAGHRKHRVELAALKSRILKFREKQGIPPRNAVTIVGAADKPAALQNERTNERTKCWPFRSGFSRRPALVQKTKSLHDRPEDIAGHRTLLDEFAKHNKALADHSETIKRRAKDVLDFHHSCQLLLKSDHSD